MELMLDEVVAILSRSPGALSAMLDGLPDALLTRRADPNSFSALDVLGHLIHGEKTARSWIRETTMGKADEVDDVLARWMAIAGQLKSVVRGLPSARLDARAGSDRMSIRETVHHLVEANLVVSNIVIAALANSGSTYDWTWVNPGGSWMSRLGYSKAPIGPAISTLESLTRHFAALFSVVDDGLTRTVKLYDSPGAPHYTKTVGQLLLDEVNHAREHLDALPPRRGRSGARGGGRTRSQGGRGLAL